MNIFIIPIVLYSSYVSIKKDAESRRKLAKLHAQLLTDSTEDERNYKAAWNTLKAVDEGAAECVLLGSARLAEEFKNNGEAGQTTLFRTVDDLHAGTRKPPPPPPSGQNSPGCI